MPVQKFKSFEEAEKALWNFNPDKNYYKSVSNFYRLFSRLTKIQVSKGVFKFRNHEEANEHRVNSNGNFYVDLSGKRKHT